MANERLEQIEKKIEQLKAQKQAIVAREKEKERKARTRRLIQLGSVIETRLNFNLDEVEKLCDYFHAYPQSLDKVKHYINVQLKDIEPTETPKDDVKEKIEPTEIPKSDVEEDNKITDF